MGGGGAQHGRMQEALEDEKTSSSAHWVLKTGLCQEIVKNDI